MGSMSDRQTYTGNRKTLYDQYLRIKKRGGSWRSFADELGLPNVSYLHDYVLHGTIPSNPEIQRMLGIGIKKLEYTRNKNKRLKELAQKAGWGSWSEFATAVYHDRAEIPEKF